MEQRGAKTSTQILLAGDFNATISGMKYKSNLCHHNIQYQHELDYSESGELFLDIIQEYKLFNLNTAFDIPESPLKKLIQPNYCFYQC